MTIPRDVREELHLKPGDVLFMQSDSKTETLQLGKAINPFDVLAEHAKAEYAAGRAKNLRQIAEELAIDLDGE